MSLIAGILLDGVDVDKPQLREYLEAREIIALADKGAFGDDSDASADVNDAAIDEAYDELSAEGGIIWAGIGTFVCGNIEHVFSKPVRLTGAGRTVSRIRIAEQCGMFQDTANPYGRYLFHFRAGPSELDNLYLDGNSRENFEGDEFLTDVPVRVASLVMVGFFGQGAQLIAEDIKGVHIHDCTFYDAAGQCVDTFMQGNLPIGNAGNHWIYDLNIHDNEFEFGQGVQVALSDCVSADVHDNYHKDAYFAHFQFYYRCSNCSFHDNRVEFDRARVTWANVDPGLKTGSPATTPVYGGYAKLGKIHTDPNINCHYRHNTLVGAYVYVTDGLTRCSVEGNTIHASESVGITVQPGPGLSISSLTRSGTTATANTAAPHLLATGASVVVSGADQSGYNLTTSITVVDADTFTYTVDSGTVTPATGTPVFGTFVQNSITRNKIWRSDQPGLYLSDIPAPVFVAYNELSECCTKVLSPTYGSRELNGQVIVWDADYRLTGNIVRRDGGTVAYAWIYDSITTYNGVEAEGNNVRGGGTMGDAVINTGGTWPPVSPRITDANNIGILQLEITLTAAEVKALNATPKTLVPAPAAGKAIIFEYAQFFLDWNSVAYDGIAAGEDGEIRYNNGAGQLVATVEWTGFISATADAYRLVYPAATAALTPVAGQPLVLTSAGEIATGDSPLKVRVLYRIATLGF